MVAVVLGIYEEVAFRRHWVDVEGDLKKSTFFYQYINSYFESDINLHTDLRDEWPQCFYR